jgi:hypothetical protein
MKTLVLDKSVLKAASPETMRSLRRRFNFLLSDTLFHEIVTERLKERNNLTETELSQLNRYVYGNLNKAIRWAGNSWINHVEALTWEAQKGQSGRHSPYSRITRLLNEEELFDPLIVTASLELDNQRRFLASAKHAPEEHEQFKNLRRMSEAEILNSISRDYWSDKGIERLKLDARDLLKSHTTKCNLSISSNLDPDIDWLSFGYSLAAKSSLISKLWRYGDEVADPKKPANTYYDMDYIAHIAITDGLISADIVMLKIAWACWPAKRDNIFVFHFNEQNVRLYKPTLGNQSRKDPC